MSTNMLNVWVMTGEFAPIIIGGLGTVATELTRTLSSLRVNMKVITVSKGQTTQIIKNKNATIVRVPNTTRFTNYTKKSFKPDAVHQLATRHLNRKPNLIHVHSLEFAETALFFKRKYNIPVIYTCHSLVSMETRQQVGRNKYQEMLIRQADRIVVPSLWLKQEIQKRFTGINLKIKVIPNGVRSVAKMTQVSPYKLLFVGRLIRSKGIEPLIGSIPSLSAKNQNVRLTVIGKGSPKYRNYLKAVAKNKGVITKIKWLGALPQRKVQRLYSSFGAVVVPSRQESFCLVALEAMANGIPLVSSRAGGLKEFVNTGNSQIISVVESRAIGRAISNMWDNPRLTRKRLIAAKHVAKRYSWRRVAILYKQLYQEVKIK